MFDRARAVLPGGVNSPARAWGSVDGEPVFARKGSGQYLYAEDGRTYVDYCMSWGPLILGHAHPAVLAAVSDAVADGLSFGMPTRRETEFAELVCEIVPSLEKVRFVSSGTEAAMTAIRLARGATGRDRIVKFDGCYHGHSDSLLVQAGSGVTGLPQSSSAGIPQGVVRHTYSLPYNDLAAVRSVVEDCGGELAAIIVEPVAGNMGVVPPAEGFLEGLRALASQCGALLVFDEVMTGFRVSLGGAQELYGVLPDITVLGKIIGGGMPVGAVGGSAAVMDCLAPLGQVYQAGTLSGNPVAMAAGLATVRWLRDNRSVYRELADRTETLCRRLPGTVNRVGSMFTAFCTDAPVANAAAARAQDGELFRRRHAALLAAGVYIPPSMFEASFLSICHRQNDLDQLAETCLHHAP
jgi:glutamate-1-semialdehyde 2,1-aminomutase